MMVSPVWFYHMNYVKVYQVHTETLMQLIKIDFFV